MRTPVKFTEEQVEKIEQFVCNKLQLSTEDIGMQFDWGKPAKFRWLDVEAIGEEFDMPDIDYEENDYFGFCFGEDNNYSVIKFKKYLEFSDNHSTVKYNSLDELLDKLPADEIKKIL